MSEQDKKFCIESLKVVLDHVDWGVQITDEKGCTVFYNKQASKIDGISQGDALGRNVLEMFPSLSDEESTIKQVLRTGRPMLKKEQEVTNLNGQKIYLYSNTLPIVIDGRICGAVDISKDLSMIKDLAEKVVNLQGKLNSYRRQLDRPENYEEARYTFDSIIGEDPALLAVKEKALKVAKGTSPVLVYGETGTGKELLVQAIHNASPRRHGPFITQNCAALPENLMESLLFGTVKGSFTGADNRPGLVELADGGTLFLDELPSMGFDLQAKLLRFIQEKSVRRLGDTRVRQVDVRIIASTNIEPLEALKCNLLRSDLYYRLNVVSLSLPPLRQRKEDIPLLVAHFLSEINSELGKNIKGISPEVERIFMRCQWPGNIRELRGVIEGAAHLCEENMIEVEHLHEHILKEAYQKEKDVDLFLEAINLDQDFNKVISSVEKELILRALERAGQNVSKAAKILGIPRQTLQYKIKTLGLS
ncbi:MAG: sigma-54 interaction domain-containing protein [Bacillota bacterium]